MKIWRITGSLARTVGDIGMAVDRHVAPAEQHLAFGLRTARSISSSQARREAIPWAGRPCPTPYSPGGGRSRPAWPSLRGRSVGDLDQDAGTVAHQRVGTHRTTVIQVLQDLQACSTIE
jgi:hypothetical protein